MSEMLLDPTIPTIRDVLGFALGERPVQHHEMLRYFERLAEVSPRLRLRRYGLSYAGLPLLALTVSSPDNLARLAEHQASLRDLDGCDDAAQAQNVASSLPAVVWLGYGIHGDEPSGSDAALETAYRLAARTDSDCATLLDRLIIHLDPMANPDGRERYLAHVRAFGRASAAYDPQDLLHTGQWPGGRGNRYLFDLNRDAIFGVQQESRARIRAVLAASPQLFVDVHEMGADDTYLFAVPAQPLNPNLPATVHDSWAQFSQDHAAAFDSDGTSYYTRSWNEVFFPGFFDIWPAYHGAVPILYEQAGMVASTVRLPNGRTRDYAQAVDNQLRSTFANLTTAVAAREQLLLRWWRSRRATRQEDGPQAWLILPSDEFKVRSALSLLLLQGIEVERLSHDAEAKDLHSVWQADAFSQVLPAGTLLIRTQQRLAALIRNIFDLHVPMSAEFLQRERRGIELGGKTLLLDATAWSLPLAYGAEMFWSTSVPAGNWQRVDEADPLALPDQAMYIGRYGYLYVDPSLFATGRLLALGIKVRVATEAFIHAGVSYAAGSLLIRRDDQSVELAELLASEQSRGDVRFTPVNAARVEDGPDLGDPGFVLLSAPAIAILTGACTDAASTGALWHLFDASIGIPVTLLGITRLGTVNLSQYQVLILSDVADPANLLAVLNAGVSSQLRTWVASGGTLISLGAGTQTLVEAGISSVKARSTVTERYPPLLLGRGVQAMQEGDFLVAAGAIGLSPADRSEAVTVRPVVGAGARAFLRGEFAPFEFPDAAPTSPTGADSLRRFLPRGAYLATRIKPLHWLGFGVPERLPVMFRESDALIADGGVELVGRYEVPRQLALSGLIWPEAVGYIASTAYLVRERLGSGQLVLFAGDPVFRGYSLGTQRLLLNAALLGSVFR
ncbi:M14 family zinc carboxypeptidase [Steroidobacter sp.]|uniref:M14 family zinc carboxypeptidase n=1 Tax=Steroidobacter sp. TaxID=1978227 RepID=UPI001A463479|nr:M14 family zinc carboxypeptidase [Steroidobacter sp.]MBL8271343.1 hypothetical protein [Steroidobacter sp.]